VVHRPAGPGVDEAFGKRRLADPYTEPEHPESLVPAPPVGGSPGNGRAARRLAVGPAGAEPARLVGRDPPPLVLLPLRRAVPCRRGGFFRPFREVLGRLTTVFLTLALRQGACWQTAGFGGPLGQRWETDWPTGERITAVAFVRGKGSRGFPDSNRYPGNPPNCRRTVGRRHGGARPGRWAGWIHLAKPAQSDLGEMVEVS
jgi:hypothetical protein